MTGQTSVEESSGNVFADLGLPEPSQALAKAQIVSKICDLIEGRELTQMQAAEILGIGQSKVSALMNGNLEGFSSDRLFRFLNALGQEVEIFIKPSAQPGGQAGVRVV